MNCNNYQKVVHGALWYNGKILLSKRLKEGYHKGFYQDVGGKQEKDELPIAALTREIKEETGLDVIYYNPRDLVFIDSFIYHKREIKTFLFELKLDRIAFKQIRNTEPDKQTNWELFTVEEALKKKLMPSVQFYLNNLNDNGK